MSAWDMFWGLLVYFVTKGFIAWTGWLTVEDATLLFVILGIALYIGRGCDDRSNQE